jgi:nitroreductase / dihydropteridine reductase
MSSLTESMNWRYATKKMNGTKVNTLKLNGVLEAIRLSPSSFGLQPFQVIVVKDQAIKEKMKAAAYHQPQMVDSDCVLVFAVKEGNYEAQVEALIARTAAERNMPIEQLEGYKQQILGSLSYMPTPEQRQGWAARQAYIALGVALTACAIKKIDSTPMEGFVPDTMDEILGLKEKGLKSVVMLAIGNRDEANDRLAGAKKIRPKSADFFIKL